MSVSPDLPAYPVTAVLAVLGYRTISYWLPAVPGAIAYARLRHTLEQAHPRAESGGAAQDACRPGYEITQNV